MAVTFVGLGTAPIKFTLCPMLSLQEQSALARTCQFARNLKFFDQTLSKQLEMRNRLSAKEQVAYAKKHPAANVLAACNRVSLSELQLFDCFKPCIASLGNFPSLPRLRFLALPLSASLLKTSEIARNCINLEVLEISTDSNGSHIGPLIPKLLTFTARCPKLTELHLGIWEAGNSITLATFLSATPQIASIRLLYAQNQNHLPFLAACGEKLKSVSYYGDGNKSVELLVTKCPKIEDLTIVMGSNISYQPYITDLMLQSIAKLGNTLRTLRFTNLDYAGFTSKGYSHLAQSCPHLRLVTISENAESCRSLFPATCTVIIYNRHLKTTLEKPLFRSTL